MRVVNSYKIMTTHRAVLNSFVYKNYPNKYPYTLVFYVLLNVAILSTIFVLLKYNNDPPIQ
jgi:hypothetical protein